MMSLSAVWIVLGWAAGAVAVVTAAGVVGIGRASVELVDNRREWTQRYIQLDHN